MANIHWKRALGGNFGKPGAWKGGVVPGPTDNALLDAAGTDFTVTSNKAETVASIQLAANATLDITSKIFTASAGTGSGENAGTIGIYGTAVLSVGGNLDNTGVISLNSTASGEADATTLLISSNTKLSGGGEIEMSDDLYNNIICSGVTLTNVDNLIAGAGIIGSRKEGLTLINEANGVIDATGTSSLDIIRLSGPGGFITNHGLLEGTGSGGLIIVKMDITGSGGNIVADSGSFVELGACTVTGQSLSTQTDGNISVALSHVSVTTLTTNAGHLNVFSGHLDLKGGVINSGILIVQGGVLSVRGAVTGSGHALIYGGELSFASAFDQDVVFGSDKGSGTLQLGDSQAYTGDISGFSATGASTLDLRDIGFVDSGEATFSGTSSSGTLTVTDGTHTANITLMGDYLGVNFVAGSDGSGGTTVVANGEAPTPPHGFIAAMASFGGPAGGAIEVMRPPVARELQLAGPHVMIA